MAEDIAALEQQLDDKFQEILEAVASQLKLGKYDDLSDEDQERVENEAEAVTDKWMEEAEDSPKSRSRRSRNCWPSIPQSSSNSRKRMTTRRMMRTRTITSPKK
jgi:hypothetical protein